MSKKPKILVIGDSFLDEYLYCSYRKDNPESTGSVYNINRREYHLGGAAAVAMMCSNLGGNITLCTGMGPVDSYYHYMTEMLEKFNIKFSFGLRIPETTIKTRYIVDEQIYPDRFDRESFYQLDNSELIETINIKAKNSDIILIADYGKGMISDCFLKHFKTTTPVMVDPSIDRDWNDYQPVAFIKANNLEAKGNVSKYLSKIHKCGVIITHGEEGLEFTFEDTQFIPAILTPDKKDICGAGDTIFATIGTYLAKGYSIRDACEAAVVYASQQIESFGIRPLTPLSDEDIIYARSNSQKVGSTSN